MHLHVQHRGEYVGFVIPLWVIYVIGIDMSIPYLTQIGALMPLMGHLLWGAILGFAFPITRF